MAGEWVGKGMGWQRNGLAREWVGKGMGWQGNGLAREWDGKGMGWQGNELNELKIQIVQCFLIQNLKCSFASFLCHPIPLPIILS
jgi:hypothetical protein